MNERIIELAQEAGFMLVTGDAFDENAWFECFPDQIERLAELVEAAAVARERERIIKILKGIDQTEMESEDGYWETFSGAEFGANIIKQIRGRTE